MSRFRAVLVREINLKKPPPAFAGNLPHTRRAPAAVPPRSSPWKRTAFLRFGAFPVRRKPVRTPAQTRPAWVLRTSPRRMGRVGTRPAYVLRTSPCGRMGQKRPQTGPK